MQFWHYYDRGTTVLIITTFSNPRPRFKLAFEEKKYKISLVLCVIKLYLSSKWNRESKKNIKS